MFGHSHYVPLLRLKPAEVAALGHVPDVDRDILTPIIEVVPRDFEPNQDGIAKPVEEVVFKRSEQLSDVWSDRASFLDTTNVPTSIRGSSGRHVQSEFSEHMRDLGCPTIPVIRLDSDRRLTSAINHESTIDNNGAAIRIGLAQVTRSNFRRRLNTTYQGLNLARQETDIIFDAGFIGENLPRIEAIVARLPYLNSWRSLTFLSGAFPRDLRQFSIGEHTLPRSEWLNWRNYMLEGSQLSRRAAFGDYAIQHGIYYPPPERANFSASIRYTSDDHWVIMRGESVFNDDGPGFNQWPANAQMLLDRPEFGNPEFSFGDSYIYEMANQTERTGSASTWLRAGVNRNLTFVSRQIASFFGAAVGS